MKEFFLREFKFFDGLRIFILLPILCLACQQEEKKGASEKAMNVLFISIDDLRPELPFYNGNNVHAPNLEKLASQSLVFNNAYTQYALSYPSRTSVMTGLRPGVTKINDQNTNFRKNIPDVKTLTQYFKEQGYHAVGFGKLFHNDPDFQDEQSWSEPCWAPQFPKPGFAYAKKNNLNLAHQNPFGKARPTEAAEVEDKAYPDGIMTERVIEKLGKIKNKPFFLAVGYYKPHMPYSAPKKYWDLYEQADLKIADINDYPANAPSYIFDDWPEPKSYYGVNDTLPFSDSLSQQLVHGYYACISYVDAQIGKLLNSLKENNLMDNTIVVIWSDHGYKLGDYGQWGKNSNMEIDTRIPLVIRNPKIKSAEGTTDALTELIDLYPTLCDMTGLPRPTHLQGNSLIQLWQNPNEEINEAAFSKIVRNDTLVSYTMRTHDYRLTRWSGSVDPDQVYGYELYDHTNHDKEVSNVINDPQYHEIADSLKDQLNQFVNKNNN